MVVADRAILRGNDEPERWERNSNAQPDGFKAMMRSVEIENFRGLKRFTMQGLGRVNLLVGRNNCGKTSVLEALLLLANGGNPHSTLFFAENRGEMTKVEGGWGADIAHLFSGHRVALGDNLKVLASSDEEGDRSLAMVVDRDNSLPATHGRMVLISAMPKSQFSSIKIGINGVFTPSSIDYNLIDFEHIDVVVVFLYNSMENWSVMLPRMWDDVSLTSAEQDIIAALRLVDDRIERISTKSQPHQNSRGGFIVKLKDEAQPVPIGNLGDGIWRMLALALSLNQARGGLLLIDEIDTGLHHSVMVGMWKMIVETAKKLDVQVFASTHSRDCVHALAAVCRPDVEEGSDVTIQRIEAGKEKSVPYSEAEIIAAAEYDTEVR